MHILNLAHLSAEDPFVWFDPDPQATAFYQLSSGSTGISKCIDERHQSLLSYLYCSTRARHYGAQDCNLNWLPFDHIVPILTCHLRDVFIGRNQIHVDTNLILEDPLLWMKLISEKHATHSWAPNFGFKIATQSLNSAHQDTSIDLRHVKELLNSGEMVSGRTIDAFRQAAEKFGLDPHSVIASFGMAECCTCITFSDAQEKEISSVSLRFSEDGLQAGATQFYPLGRVIPGTAIRIASSAGTTLREGEVGHLQIRGPNVTRGYHNNPLANEAALKADGWFDSGDNATIVNGCLYLTGRTKEMIVVNGVNYFCHDIEEKVEGVAGVSRTLCAALSWQENDQEQSAICYVPKPGVRVDEINKKIRERLILETGLHPKLIVPIHAVQFLKTTSGKIQRARMAQQIVKGEIRPVHVEIPVVSAWRLIGDSNRSTYEQEIEVLEVPVDCDGLSSLCSRVKHAVQNHKQAVLIPASDSLSTKFGIGALWGFANSICAEMEGFFPLVGNQKLPQYPCGPTCFDAQGNQLRIRQLQQLAIEATPSGSLNGKTVVLLGGFGGIGIQLALHLYKKGARLYVLGRHEPPKILRQLQGDRLVLIQDPLESEQELLEKLTLSGLDKAPDEIYHLAGVMDTGLASDLTGSTVSQVFMAKLAPITFLRQALEKRFPMVMQKTLWVFFGSAFTLYPTPYVAAYAAANGALLDLAQQWLDEGMKTLWLGWSYWRNTGMNANLQRDSSYIHDGLQILEPEEALLILDDIVYLKSVGKIKDSILSIGICNKQFDRCRESPRLKNCSNQSEESLIQDLMKIAEEILHQPISPNISFFEQGGTSVDTIRYQQKIKKKLGLLVDIAILLGYPSAQALAHYLVHQHQQDIDQSIVEQKPHIVERQERRRRLHSRLPVGEEK